MSEDAPSIQTTSLPTKFLHVLASPGEVFTEVAGAPAAAIHWRVPTLLACLGGTISLTWTRAETISQLTTTGALSPEQQAMLVGGWPLVASAAVCLSTVVGTFWAAFVLWSIGRIFLRVSFSYHKALEVVGLSVMIVLCGMVFTGLLIAVSGNPAVRPSLSLLAPDQSPPALIQFLDCLNVFHIWSVSVMAIGLSKLSDVSLKETAFWVFGYWLLTRMALIVLA